MALVLPPFDRQSMPACLTVVPGAADSSLYYPYLFTVILMGAAALTIIVEPKMYVKICVFLRQNKQINTTFL